MIDTAIELVADPGIHAARRQQIRGLGDQVVKIDQTARTFQCLISQRKRFASKQCAGKLVGVICQGIHLAQFFRPLVQRQGDARIMVVLRRVALGRNHGVAVILGPA